MFSGLQMNCLLRLDLVMSWISLGAGGAFGWWLSVDTAQVAAPVRSLGSMVITKWFGAMTAPRPYKPTLTVSEALAELQRCAGSQFDPEVTAAFEDAVASPRLVRAA